jgi:hypothetical protein
MSTEGLNLKGERQLLLDERRTHFSERCFRRRPKGRHLAIMEAVL